MEHNGRADGKGIDVEEEGLVEGYCREDLAVGADGEVLEAAGIVGEDLCYVRFLGGCGGGVGADWLDRDHEGWGGGGGGRLGNC